MHLAPSYMSRSTTMLVGALATVLGVVCIVWPAISVGILVAVFAIFCFADAAVQVERSIHPVLGHHRVGAALLVVVDVAAGLIAIASPGITAATLALVVGFWWLLSGVTEIGLSFTGSSPGHRAGVLLGGLLSVVAGLTLVAWPGLGAFSIALLFGFVLVFRGCGLLAMAWSRQHSGSSSETLAGASRGVSL